jgi:hypothetical protein
VCGTVGPSDSPVPAVVPNGGTPRRDVGPLYRPGAPEREAVGRAGR